MLCSESRWHQEFAARALYWRHPSAQPQLLAEKLIWSKEGTNLISVMDLVEDGVSQPSPKPQRHRVAGKDKGQGTGHGSLPAMVGHSQNAPKYSLKFQWLQSGVQGEVLRKMLVGTTLVFS